MLKRLAGLGLAFCLLAPSAWGAPAQVVRESVAVCDPNNPQNCSAPASSFAPNQITVGTSATLIVAARTGRQSVTVVSNCTTPIELGASAGVTTSNGVILPGTVGAAITMNYTGALYAIGASSCAVSYYELY